MSPKSASFSPRFPNRNFCFVVENNSESESGTRSAFGKLARYLLLSPLLPIQFRIPGTATDFPLLLCQFRRNWPQASREKSLRFTRKRQLHHRIESSIRKMRWHIKKVHFAKEPLPNNTVHSIELLNHFHRTVRSKAESSRNSDQDNRLENVQMTRKINDFCGHPQFPRR